MSPTFIIVIPARYGSSRFPGKALAPLWGRPMIEQVYRRASRTDGVARTIVATDDQRILDVVTGFGGEAMLTATTHRCGTERVAEAAANFDADIVVNVQGDQPLIEPNAIAEAVRALAAEPELSMGTLMSRLGDEREVNNPHVVKVVVDRHGDALYFSRSPIPHRGRGSEGPVFEHIGLYVYRRRFLSQLAAMSPTPLEQAEGLEQLRALENGHRIRCWLTDHHSPGVDTPEQLEQLERRGEGIP